MIIGTGVSLSKFPLQSVMPLMIKLYSVPTVRGNVVVNVKRSKVPFQVNVVALMNGRRLMFNTSSEAEFIVSENCTAMVELSMTSTEIIIGAVASEAVLNTEFTAFGVPQRALLDSLQLLAL